MSVLACPLCGNTLDTYRSCNGCRQRYPTHGDILDLLPPYAQTSPAYTLEMRRYERIAELGPEVYAGYRETKPEFRADTVRAFLEGYGERKFVNIGPGFGALEAVTMGYDGLAIDPCLGFLRYVKERYGTPCVRGIAEQLPLLSGSVDCLVAESVFQSIVNRERFLYQIGRVCQVGALLVLSIAYRWNYPRRPQNGFNVNLPHERAILLAFLEELGFDVEAQYQNVAEERWVEDKEDGDYLWLVGLKKR